MIDESIRKSDPDASGAFVWAPGGLLARRAGGEEFPVEATISQSGVRDRRLHTLILRDVDERRRAEMELRLAARKVADLEQAERRMSEQLRQANEALVQSEERFRDLFDEAPIAYVHEDLDTRFVRANRAAMRILGIKPEEVAAISGSRSYPIRPTPNAACAKPLNLSDTAPTPAASCSNCAAGTRQTCVGPMVVQACRGGITHAPCSSISPIGC